MAKSDNLNDFLTDLGSAIKDKRGSGNPINAQDFADEIRAIEPLLDTLNITENGKHSVKDYKNVEVGIQAQGDTPYIKLINGTATEFSVPYGTTTINDRAFYSYNNLILHIPTSVKTIGGNILSQPEYTTTINLYYQGTLEQWLMIPKGNYDYKGIVEGNNSHFVLHINNEKIEGSYTLPRTLTELAYGSLSHINLGGTTETNYKLTIPKEITKIEKYAFYNFIGINELEFEDNSGNIVLGEYAFSYLGVKDPKGLTLKKITLPPCESLPKHLLENAQYENLIISEGTKIIDEYCFNNNSKTTKVLLPSTLEKINKNAFSSNSSLTEITIPSNVNEMGTNALYYCSKLKIINFESTIPFTLGSSALPKNSGARYYVPKGTSGLFKSATNWSTYASYIYEKYVVVMNIPNALLNNETITYSVDSGKTYQKFTNSVFSLNEVATIKIKSTDSTQTILIGTTEGGNDVGTISNSELTFSFTTDTNVYLTIQ